MPNNTSLTDFITQYATPYDPATDTYRRPPFASPTKAGKATAIYNAHSYHTKVPPQGIEPYIAHYTEPGDLVLDPFCGSGMTGVAALMLDRRVILNDLSPAAVHIAYNYCTPIAVAVFKHEFERIKAAVKDEFEWLYGTTCDRCGGLAIIQHTIWSDVFECGRCGADIVLWKQAFDQDSDTLSKSFACPNCGKEWRKAQLRRSRAEPVITSYECQSGCKPKRQQRPISEAERRLLSEIDEKTIPYWYPKTRLNPDSEMYIRGALHLRGVQTVDQLFTKRNLWALARLWHEISQTENNVVTARLQFCFTAICQLVSRMRRYRAGGFGGNIMSGLIYLPSLNLDVNVLKLWQTKFDDIRQAAEEMQPFLHENHVAVNVGSATDVSSIPGQTIDYVFCDPPFGMNLYYSDLNVIWESWLGQFTDPSNEAVVHREQKTDAKTLSDYARLMTDAFREMYRVLKPNRWASVVFHNSDDKIWQTILDAAQTAGLELAQINSFDKEQLSFKGVRGDKGLERVANKDIVLNLRKPGPEVTVSTNGKSATARNGDAEARIVQQLAEFLSTNPPAQNRTLQHFWNVVLHEMLVNGIVEVSMEQVGDMLPYYFKQVDGKWYLRGEAVVGGNVFDLKSDSGALTWLNAVLMEPQTTGDLIPKWQAAIGRDVDPGRLERLLLENFWFDKRSGRWRTPTDVERASMNATQDLAAEAHLRVIQKYLAGQSDHQPHNRELAEWVRFAYHREAYAEAVALYAHVDESQLEDEFVKSLRKIVAVCKMKIGSKSDKSRSTSE